MSNTLKISLLAGAIGACALSLPAAAQPYNEGYYGPPNAEEQVIIQAPRYPGPSRSVLGAPIRTYGVSEAVRYGDLDLRTDWGVHRLRERIDYTAGQLCRRLNQRYPISFSSGHDCYHMAVAGAVDQADAAIDRARGGD